MPSNLAVSTNVGTLPQAFNPGGDWQVVLNEFFKAVSFYVPGSYNFFNYGSTTPSVENQDRPWFRLNGDGSPDRIYTYFNGKWVARHLVTASSSYRAIWTGSLASLYSFDGGDGTDPASVTPTATTGAMWQEDEDMRDKIPMGVLASTGQVSTVGATAGELSQDVTLTVENLPRHRHEVTMEDAGDAEGTGDKDDPDSTGRAASDSGDIRWLNSSKDNVGYTRYYGNVAPDAITIAKVPPVVGVFFIKRTARVFLTP